MAFGAGGWLLGLFRSLRIAAARCREQARKSLVSCSLNLAEGAGRRSRADKSRVYAIEEDERPWIRDDPRAMCVVLTLRRLAYTLLARFRAVSQRSAEKRATPWKELLRAVQLALLTAHPEPLRGLKHRPVAAPG